MKTLSLVFLLANFVSIKNSDAVDFKRDGKNVCKTTKLESRSYTTLEVKHIKENKKTKCGLFGWSRCGVTKTHTKSMYVIRNRYVHVDTFHCCDGWISRPVNGQKICDKPYCRIGCKNQGTCIGGQHRCKCKEGWTGNFCGKDVNECNTNNGGCQQVCTNTPGSFSCGCRRGYQTDDKNPRLCKDANECNTDNGECQQVCTNTPGSFYCGCRRGYQKDNKNQKLCKEFIEYNGFNITGSNVCRHSISKKENITIPVRHMVSEQYIGKCKTSKGWSWWGKKPLYKEKPCKKYRTVTKIVNEIMEKVYYGYSLKCCLHWERKNPGDMECKKPICPNGCNHGKCIAGDTCKCEPGWQGYTCNQDVNECYMKNGGCQHDCVNKIGSYACVCGRGYTHEPNDTSKCIDVNECKGPKPRCFCARKESQCKPTCVNKVGSFRCQCSKGYQLYGPSTCIDINECKTPNHGCEQHCLNMYSSYRCRCNLGFRLAPDRKKCIKIQLPGGQ